MQSTPPARVIQVAVPRPLHSVYDYMVPDELDVPEPGARVEVPFGRSRTIGICTSNQVTSPHAKLKAITALLDTTPLVNAELMELAHWMTRYYHYPLGEVLSTILPVAARRGQAAELKPADCWQTTASAPAERARKQTELYAYIQAHPGISGEAVVEAGFTRALLRKLINQGHIEPGIPPLPTPQTGPAPNAEQQHALDAIRARGDRFTAFLLDGITGSGKTEVYLQAMAPIIASGRQALVLVPEIGLTPQTVGRFQARFPRTGVLHSDLTDVARYQTWLRCQNGELDVLVGTRSAVFTPFKSLGIVVVDEEHDSSYKQQEGLRYSARDIAVKRAHELKVPLVLGSATPALESLHNARQGRYQHLHLTERAGGAALPSYHVIDMRGETQTDGISNPLVHVIKRHLSAGNQVLVFLNRRGFAPTLLCSACGWQAQCSDCDAKLTMHTRPPQLVCHHCGLRFQTPATCDACGQAALMPVGIGTQRSEAGLAKLFPEVPIYRIDRDTTRSNAALEARFDTINQGASCIMIGTQMLAKGHHFPDVTLVVVLNADAGFLSPDFRAPERTAQIIVQVAGRAGRAEKPGEVWIQSFQPDSPALTQLISEGYAGFAEKALAERQLAGLPPWNPMAMLRAEATAGEDAVRFLNTCKQQLTAARITSDPAAGGAGPSVSVFGPVAAPLARQANRTRYQLMVLADSRQHLHHALDHLQPPRSPGNLRWSIDVDPYDGL